MEFISGGQVIATDTGGLNDILALGIPNGSVGHFEGTAFNSVDEQVVRRPASGTIPVNEDSGPHTFFFELGSLANGGGSGNGGTPPSSNGGGDGLILGMSPRTALIAGGVGIVALAGLAIFMSRK